MSIRIGQGFDAHRFETGGKLVLGGVHIPHTAGLEAHSDGDVLIHALCDAILGAACLGDIGRHFPDVNPDFANMDSRIMLRHSVDLIHEHGLEVVNVDTTVLAEHPRISPYADDMRQYLAADLQIPGEAINIKATTTEGMGFVGRGDGIAAMAVVLLQAM